MRGKITFEFDVEDLESVLKGLDAAIATIRAFSGLGMNEKTEIITWALYQRSPEMKLINTQRNLLFEMIRKLKGEK